MDALSPEAMRRPLGFISEDQARDGSNWYAYCINNPLRFVDPSGVREIIENGIDNPQTQTAPSNIELQRKRQTDENAQQLLQTIQDVTDPNRQYPQFQAGYPNWWGAIMGGNQRLPGQQPGIIHCNESVNEILVQFMRDTSVILNPNPNTGRPSIGYTNANEMAQNARAAAADPTSGVIELSPEKAQWFGNQGIPVAVLAEDTRPGKAGHVGVVSPSSQTYDLK